jgi:hypothetical protein
LGKNSIDIGMDWRGWQVLLADKKCVGSDSTASATSVKRESLSWLPLGTTGIRVPVGSPDIADREQAIVAVSNKVVIIQTAAARTLGRLSSPCQEKNEHY